MEVDSMNRTQRITWVLAGAILSFAVACNGRTAETGMSPVVAVETTLVPLDTDEPQATPTLPVATTLKTATPSATETMQPSATRTPRPTEIPTLPPLPTIPPAQRGQTYSEWMADNGGCELPCWWGIELGKTSIEEARQLYASFGTFIYSDRVDRNGASVLEAIFEEPQIQDGVQVRHVFLAQDGIIIEAEIEAGRDPNYQIEPLLQWLGQPAEVWLWTIPESRQGILPASFRLYFPQQGVLVGYGVLAERVGDAVQACFDEEGSVILHLWQPTIWDPNNSKGFIERTNEGGQLTLREDHRPIDQVSNWDVEMFYTSVIDPDNKACLQTPAELWPDPGVE